MNEDDDDADDALATHALAYVQIFILLYKYGCRLKSIEII